MNTAYIKALGVGLELELSRISFVLDETYTRREHVGHPKVKSLTRPFVADGR